MYTSTLALDGATGQLHTPATYILERAPITHLTELVQHQSSSGYTEQKICTPIGQQTDFPVNKPTI